MEGVSAECHERNTCAEADYAEPLCYHTLMQASWLPESDIALRQVSLLNSVKFLHPRLLFLRPSSSYLPQNTSNNTHQDSYASGNPKTQLLFDNFRTFYGLLVGADDAGGLA